ncbi:1-acylglycerol-3-phosphate O-acyltransferase [Thalassotalea litorea]|uniref:1-acyl-sn-glycerol-3-phosphate acyltransferase n=1 Tax=Thalassotalea litorea TaxID=2020715 RepID=A0A5R9IP49_9GAMM|nr:1-acylglycerol-3-phosphate O-acyltransferase [Thalassotalea litorea]TLU67290.1 1-acylglycerol-3-phosphate O-acyltransferase [Thalassotalea litorea]
MLAILRILTLAFSLVLTTLTSILMCIIRPFHRDNVYFSAHLIGGLSPAIGVKLEVRKPEGVEYEGPVVYVCNHQNSYDIFTVAGSLPKGTVSIGKKSLKWIPFFGQMYWFTGNILIDRANRSKAHSTIASAAQKIKERNISVWLFPEGTRSYGRGLLPFKTGAFHTAMQADVPIVPVCVSNSHNLVDLNRWNNGKMIIEFLPPIHIHDKTKEGVRHVANNTHELMLAKINELSVEAGNPFQPLHESKQAEQS